MRTRQDIAAWWDSLSWHDRAHILGIRYLGTKIRMPVFANLNSEETLIVLRYCAQEVITPWQSRNPSEASPAV
jgi:hypothetical protein